MTANEEKELKSATFLIDRYVALAQSHGKATEDGNSVKANAYYKDLQATFSEIVKADERERLVTLLDHPNARVRAAAAFHTYKLNAERSATTLEQVSQGDGLVAFSAAMTLKQLRNGVLKPP
jgi:hypothetical protein